MEVSFVSTTAAKASDPRQVPIVNGQLIYLTDKNIHYYDSGSHRICVSGVVRVAELPTTGQQENIIYVVVDANGVATSSIWDSTSSSYIPISANVATVATAGLVKPDGTTITIANDGTISSHNPVTSLPARSITYDNTTSGTTATNAQGAIDEIAETANSAQSDADYAMTQIVTLNNTVADLQTRLAAVEAIAARALMTEDPASEQNGTETIYV